MAFPFVFEFDNKGFDFVFCTGPAVAVCTMMFRSGWCRFFIAFIEGTASNAGTCSAR